MTHESTANPLAGLLELASRLEELSFLLGEESVEQRDRLLAARRFALKELARRLTHQALMPPLFAEAGAQHRLRPRELMVLLILLCRRIEAGGGYTTGRDLLAPLARGAWQLLRGARLLEASGRLITSGLIRFQTTGQAQGLDASYRVAEGFYRRVAASIRPGAGEGPDTSTPPGQSAYLSALHHLRDLKRLVDLHVERAALLFSGSFWSEMVEEPTLTPADATECIMRLRSLIAERETATQDHFPLPIRAFRIEHSLEDDEETLVLALLFSDVLVSSSFIDSGDLIRLCAANETEVLRKRSLLAQAATLRDQGILQVESESDRGIHGEASLAPWVCDQLLSNLDDQSAIRDDEQIRFHRYLSDLDDSDDFYKQL